MILLKPLLRNKEENKTPKDNTEVNLQAALIAGKNAKIIPSYKGERDAPYVEYIETDETGHVIFDDNFDIFYKSSDLMSVVNALADKFGVSVVKHPDHGVDQFIVAQVKRHGNWVMYGNTGGYATYIKGVEAAVKEASKNNKELF